MDIRNKQGLVLMGVMSLILLVYSNTFQAEFHLDDISKIKNNLYVHLHAISMENLWKVFSQNRPIAHLSFALNYYFSGLDVSAYHAVNLLIHLISTFALYLFVRLTLTLPTFKQRWNGYEHWVAIIAAFLWAIHPVQTQAVTYVVQRMTLLSSMFYLLALLFYIMGRRSNSRIRVLWYTLLVLAIPLAIGSKEMAATLPVFIVLYEWYFLSGSFVAAIRKATLIIVLCSLFTFAYVMSYLAEIQTGGLDAIRELFVRNYIPFEEQSYSFLERTLTQMRVMVHYLSLLLFPYPGRLNLDYDFPVSHSLIDPWTTALSLLFVLGTILYACIFRKRYPLLSFCILWFYGNLVIESFIFQIDLIFEHRLYLPSMGFMLLVSTGIVSLVERGSHYLSDIQKAIYVMVAACVIALLCLWTYERNSTWRTEISLWEDVVEKSPKKARGYLNLGQAYQERKMLGKADEVYQAGLANNPPKHYLVRMLINRGLIQLAKRDYPVAIGMLEQAVQIDPHYHLALYNLATAYLQTGQYDLALSAFEKSRDLYSQLEWTHLYIAKIYERRGDTGKAIDSYKRGITAMGNDTWRLRNDLARVYGSVGRFQDAATEYQLSLGENRQQPEIHNQLGMIYYRQRRFKEALEEFKETLHQAPDHLNARNNLGSTYAAMGDIERAIKEFSWVLGKKPDHSGARQNLDRARKNLESTR